MGESQVHRSSLITTTWVKLNTFVVFTLLFEVLGWLNHNLLGAHHRHRHNLLIEVIFFGQTNSMGQPTRLRVVEDRIRNVTLTFKVPSDCEAGLRVTGWKRDLGCCKDISNAAEHSHTAAEVLSLSVHLKSFLYETLSLEVLGPPFVQSRVPLWVNKVLKSLW